MLFLDTSSCPQCMGNGKNPIPLNFHIITKQILRLGEKGPQVAKQGNFKREYLNLRVLQELS